MAMGFAGRDDVFGRQQIDIAKLQTFIGKDLFLLAETYLQSDSWHERSIGVASVVALSQPLVIPDSLRERGFDVPDGETDFASCIRPDDIVAVVGYGGGIKRLLGRCRELHVTDMRPRQEFQTTLISGKRVEYVPEEAVIHSEDENEEVLGRATAVAITGSALVNGTFDDLLRFAKRARLITVYGASAGLIPDLLLAGGVHMVHSSRIVNPAAFERGMMNDMNMEAVMQATQTQQTVRRRLL
jgi:uncharacterized protein